MNSSTVYIFDIDGVITDQDQNVNPKVIEKIATLLPSPVAFVTGRPPAYIRKNIIDPLQANASDPKLIENVYIEAEFGGVKMSFENGIENKEIRIELEPPKELIEKGREIAARYPEVTWFEPKENTISLSCIPGKSLETFHKDQEKIIPEFEKFLKETGLDAEFDVQKDMLGSNIRHKGMNKSTATANVIGWLSKRGQAKARYYGFGDSKGDLEIAAELKKQGKDFEFIFVGEEKDLGDTQDLPVKITNKKFDQGTLEYLNLL